MLTYKTNRIFLSNKAYISSLFILSFVITIINLGISKEFIGEDSGLQYFFKDRFAHQALFIWDSFWAPGKLSLSSSFSLFWSLISLLFRYLGASYFIYQRVLFFLTLFIPATGIFFLIQKIFTAYSLLRPIKIISFLCSLIYIFNPYTAYLLGFPLIPFHITYMLLPWVLFLFFKFGKEPYSSFQPIVFSILILLFIGGNPANTILSFLLLSLFILFYYKTFNYKFLIYSVINVILLSLYIIFPIIILRNNPYGGNIDTLGDYLNSLKFNSNFTSLKNLFVLGGTAAWNNFPAFTNFYGKPFFILSSFIISITSFFSLLSIDNKKGKLILIITFIFIIFFAKGTQFPYGIINQFLYENINLLAIYRAVYNKFILFALFPLILLFSLALLNITKSINKNKYMILLFFLIFINAYPFLSGKIIKNNSNLIDIPQEYRNLSELSLNKNFKTLSLPPSPNGSGLILKWLDNQYYVGPHIDAYILNNPVIDGYWFIDKKVMGLNVIDSWTGEKFIKNLYDILLNKDLFNIKYIFLHKDFALNYYFGPSGGLKRIDSSKQLHQYKIIIENFPDIKKIVDTKYYTLYEFNDEKTVPIFYIPTSITYTANEIKSIFKNKNVFSNNVFLSKKIQDNTIKKPLPQIKIYKRNSTKYEIDVYGAHSSFILVFSETFNHNWRIYLKQQNQKTSKILNKFSFLQPIENIFNIPIKADHYLANGYANAWLIKPMSTNNKTAYKLIVEFYPQAWFYVGLIISGITLFSLIGTLTFLGLRSSRASRFLRSLRSRL